MWTQNKMEFNYLKSNWNQIGNRMGNRIGIKLKFQEKSEV